MEIFDKIGEVASQTYKFTTEKADKFAKEAKLKMKMNENKSKIETLYNEIGKAVYRTHIIGKSIENSEEIKLACEEIDKISEEIKKQNDELLRIKKKKQCPNCHQEIERTSKYCNNCGYKQDIADEEEVKDDNSEVEEEDSNDAIETNATEEEKASNDNNE